MRDGRTVVDTLRQEGLARCSRPFAEPGGFVRLVTLHLGPGFVRGDRFECEGSVGAGGRLAVVSQAATRVSGRGAASSSSARWRVGVGGTLHLLGEPLVAYEAAEHRATLDVELDDGATFAFVDAIAASGTFAQVATRVRVRAGAALVVHDALTLTPQQLRGAVGSAYVLVAGIGAAGSARYVAAADAAAGDASRRYGVRVGIGSPAAGGVSIRALGAEPWNVRAALSEIVAALAPSHTPSNGVTSAGVSSRVAPLLTTVPRCIT